MSDSNKEVGVLLRALAEGKDLGQAAQEQNKKSQWAQGILVKIADRYDPPVKKISLESQEDIVIFIDGGARGNPGPAGCGVVIQDNQGNELVALSEFLGIATNNEAEYSGLVLALEKASELTHETVEIRTDSELLARQMTGQYKVKAKNLLPFYIKANKLMQRFRRVRFTHVPREQNKEADHLANEAMDRGVF